MAPDAPTILGDDAPGEVALADGAAEFTVAHYEPAAPAHTVLFAAGRGGDPRRHAPLLRALAERGCRVVAPRFELIASLRPSADDLALRARRLRLALDALAPGGGAVAGVGHSIGATLLLALAGAQPWLGPGQPLPIERAPRLARLALLAPTTGFFQAPRALDAVTAPLLVWSGDRDDVTPPSHGELLARALRPRVAVELRVAAGAGHFSFMDVPPPHTAEPHADRDALLAEVTASVAAFVTS
jgi:pimeloyl-ACP methyl ester carboxylesterase